MLIPFRLRVRAMLSCRFKSRKYVRYPPLAFCVFGEIRPLHTKCTLRVWDREGAPPIDIVCDTHEIALRQKELMKEGDLNAYEAYARE